MGNRWVVVDANQENHIILGGPYIWEGAPWQPPIGSGTRWAADMLASGELIEESDAITAGYSYPPPPDIPWVAVDHQTMQIIGGPWDWNGEGTAPDERALMPQWMAESSGYAWP